MRCKNCPAGKKQLRNGHRCVKCLLYGMVLKEEHECDREGWKDYDRHEDHGENGERAAEIQKDSSGAASEVPGIISGSGI